jgi:CHAD domain-containing protein
LRGAIQGSRTLGTVSERGATPMAYRLDFNEPPDTAARRCASERIEDAIAQLDTGREDDPETAVHEARKDVKKTRALLRLYRRDLGDATYRHENRELRDAGRALSGMRDADVLLDTLDGLAERYAGQVPGRAFDAVRERLRADDVPAPSVDESVDAARARLSGALGRVEDWPLGRTGRSSVRKGLKRSYARGRRALERAAGDRSDERLHEWRKRVKDLRYQQQLVRDAWPQVIGAQAKAAKALADLLGDDHDLAVLDARMRASGEVGGELDDVLALIARRRTELQDEALRLGRRLYAESPKRFGERVGRYLRAAARESPVEQAA